MKSQIILLLIYILFIFSPKVDASENDNPMQFYDGEEHATKTGEGFADEALDESRRILESKFCLPMPPDMGRECSRMVENFAAQAVPLILRIILSKEDNCRDMGSCSHSIDEADIEDYLIRDEVLMDKNKTDPLTSDEGSMQVGETRICSACRVILYKLRTALKNPMTQAIMLKILLRACTKTNRRYIRKCKKMVTTYGPVAVTMMSRFVNVVDLCGLTHFCQVLGPESIEAGAFNKFTREDQRR